MPIAALHILLVKAREKTLKKFSNSTLFNAIHSSYASVVKFQTMQFYYGAKQILNL